MSLSSPVDNRTAGRDYFITKYCGSDLKQVVQREIENKYLQKLRKASKQFKAKKPIDINEKQLSAIQSGELKVKTKKPVAPPVLSVLSWNGIR